VVPGPFDGEHTFVLTPLATMLVLASVTGFSINAAPSFAVGFFHLRVVICPLCAAVASLSARRKPCRNRIVGVA